MPFDHHDAYDELNRADHDHRFYTALARDLSARRVLDLGCGTGVLARRLARAGHAVVAVDPDPDMLAIARARPGATRNPAARGWQAWTREATLRTVSTANGRFEVWHEVVAVDLPRVTYDTLTRDLDTGEQTRTRDELAFRSRSAVLEALRHTGFAITEEFGDWSRSPVTPSSPELIVIARRA